MPKRIQRSRSKGWRMPEGAVYVGHPTLWGNPFVCDDAKRAVDAFRQHCEPGTKTFDMGPGKLQFAANAHRNTMHWQWAEWFWDNVPTLRGKDLVCWCAPDAPCHADVLLEIANAD